jgi:hypothetical protein
MESEAQDGCSCPARLCINLELRTGGPCCARQEPHRPANRLVWPRRGVRNPEEARGVFRAVPVPPELLDALDMVHGIREAQRRGQVQAPLWP